MAQDKFKRKLTTIFSADVAGYSRLMGEDEAATVKTLEQYKEVMAELIRQYRGRVVDSPGDNLLAEFPSVVDAVQCAVATQKELQARNAALPENRKMRFRIGVNLGDVIEEESRIYGDGVNIAARLESLADPGGICVSKTAFDQIETKLPFGYEFLGDQTVKNIARPVGAYKVLMEPRVAKERGSELKKQDAKRKKIIIGIATALVAIVGVVLWQFFLRPAPPTAEKADPANMALPLPELPSIAVLPFINLGDDSKQELLSDGITVNIINALSKIPRLFVIARNSVFTYKGKAVKVKQVSEELGVRYVLEGSFQQLSDRVRITAQLIDALTGHQLWAERYDSKSTDLFALIDDITLQVLNAVRVKLTEGQGKSAYTKYFTGRQGLDCYLKMLEAENHLQHQNVADTNLARQIAEQALVMCPDNPAFYRILANVNTNEYWLGSSKNPRDSVDNATEFMHKILAMDDGIADAHSFMSHVYTLKKEYEKSIVEAERGVALEPGSAWALFWYAAALQYDGRSAEAIPVLEKAIRLNPFGPYNFYHYLGNALSGAGRFEQSIAAFKKVLERAPNYWYAYLGMTLCFIRMGQDKEAQAMAAEILRINPKFSLEFYSKTTGHRDRSKVEKIIAELRKAGVPEKSPPAQP